MTDIPAQMPRLLDSRNRDEAFPDTALALAEPDGLLAIGGDLSVTRLLNAYRNGIFPWYSDGQPILWWSPDPRAILIPEQLHLPRSLRKNLRNRGYRYSFDCAFSDVVSACAAPRNGDPGTWITRAMSQAYLALFDAGYAHSVECWREDQLVGGLYGVSIGRIFFGESMFSSSTDASKCALVCLAAHLQSWSYPLIDAQVASDHLDWIGSISIPRTRFNQILDEFTKKRETGTTWCIDPELVERVRASGGRVLLESTPIVSL